MTLRRLPALLLLALPALAPAVEELPLPDGLPAEVKALLERELAPLPAVEWKVGDRLAGKVEAKAPPAVEAGEEMDGLEIPLGTDVPVSCALSRERIDPGAWAWRFLDAVGKKVKVVSVRPVELAVVDGSPLLFLDALYVLEAKEGNRLGLLKVAVYAHDSHMFLCHQDEPGYRKSFRRVVGGLAAGLRGGEDGRTRARYAEVTAMRVGTVPVGFAETVVWDRKGGGSVARTTTTLVMPRTPGELASLDSFEEEESDAKDLMVGGSYASTENGELSKTVRLTRRGDGKAFAVEGKQAGKDFKASFDAKEGLASDLWFIRRFAAKARPVAEAKHATYGSAEDPTHATVVTYHRVKGSARQVEVSDGSMTYTTEVDDLGVPVKAELPLGPVRVSMERVWSRGAP